MENTSKAVYKKQVKRRIEDSMITEMRGKAGTKMRTVLEAGFGMKKYIQNGDLREAEIREVLKLRLHMGNMRNNDKASNIETNCQFCGETNETTEHVLLKCESLQYLREDLELKEKSLHCLDVEVLKALLKMDQRVQWIKIT